MNVLMLTLGDFSSFNEQNIYCDLLREFIKNGHSVYCISPTEKRYGQSTHFEENGHLLKLRTGNVQKTNIIEKGISTVLIEPQFKLAIKKYFSHIKFDLILYSTPPITLIGAIEYVKKRDKAATYLMLKDIFPQNAVDLGMMQKTGIKSLLYKYFRSKEEKLYAISDKIGCMSQANVDYLLTANKELNDCKVEICPNAIDVIDLRVSQDEKMQLRQKYGLPLDRKLFIYGGNLGKPQCIPFIIECLKSENKLDRAFFAIVGDGTEYGLLEDYVKSDNPSNVRVLIKMKKEEFDNMLPAFDAGLIFLDSRFTIPNYPSRLLAYMQAGLPVLCCTDAITDIGKNAVENKYGWSVNSEDVTAFNNAITEILKADIAAYGQRSFEYLCNEFSVQNVYNRVFSKE